MHVEYRKHWNKDAAAYRWRWLVCEGGEYETPAERGERGAVVAESKSFYETRSHARADLARVTEFLAAWIADEQVRALSGDL